MKAAVLLVAALVLAGCSDGPPQTSDDEFAGIDTTAATGKGVIRGIVLDQEIRPVPGALIEIERIGQEAISNDEGIFVFQDLDPGVYFLAISAQGYVAVQQSTDVVADVDRPPIVKVQLLRNEALDPRVLYTFFEGYIGCSAQVANFVQDNVCGIAGGLDPDIQAPLSFQEPKAPRWLQTELQWEHTQPIGERLGIIQYMAGEGGGRIGNIWGTSPQTCRVGPDAPCDNGDGTGGGGTGLNGTTWTDQVSVRVFANCFYDCLPDTAVGLGLVLQQDYQVYGTLFYNMDPRQDWTFIGDGEYGIV